MFTKRFDFNYDPYRVSYSIAVVGGVADEQNYSTYTSEFTPDYTLAPLVLQPKVSRMGDAPVRLNSSLTNIRWTQIVDGVETTITTSTSGYSLTLSGENAGRITVKKNGTPGSNVTLKFHAEYYDSRNRQTIVIEDTHLLTCYQATEAVPVLTIDAPDDAVTYNPLRDADSMVINASLKIEGKEVATANRLFVWEVSRDGSTWSAIGDNTMDFCFSVASDGTSCTLNRAVMGDIIRVRCRAKYSATGAPSSVALSSASPSASVTIRRRIPKLYVNYNGAPNNIEEDAKTFYVEAAISDATGVISNPEKMLALLWKIAPNTSTGAAGTFEQVAHGATAVLSTDPFDSNNGAQVALDVEDKGGFCALADADGTLLADADGSLILIN